jgi:hypothetical protein
MASQSIELLAECYSVLISSLLQKTKEAKEAINLVASRLHLIALRTSLGSVFWEQSYIRWSGFVAIASNYWGFHMQLDILQVVSPQCSLICPRQSYEKKIRVAGPAEQDMQFLDLWLRLWRSKEGREAPSWPSMAENHCTPIAA